MTSVTCVAGRGKKRKQGILQFTNEPQLSVELLHGKQADFSVATNYTDAWIAAVAAQLKNLPRRVITKTPRSRIHTSVGQTGKVRLEKDLLERLAGAAEAA